MLSSRSYSESAFSESPEGPVSVQGLSATGSVGSVVATGNAIVSVSGVGGTGAVGTAEARFPVDVAVTGLSGTSSVGTAVGSIPVDVAVTGLSASTPMTATGAGGPLFGGMAFSQESFSSLADGPLNIQVLEGAGAIVTGLEATGEIGSVAITGDAIVPVTGLEATGTVNDVTVTGDAIVAVTGLAATSADGTVTVVEGTGVDAAVTSPRLRANVGVATAIGEISVLVTGVEATGEVGQVGQSSWNSIIPSQNANWVEIAA